MAKKNYVVAFDIDGTLCCNTLGLSEIKKIRAINPECPIIFYQDEYLHIFIPYLQVLINYLITSEVRIVFFSSAVEDRNSFVISKLLEEILGNILHNQKTVVTPTIKVFIKIS